ncbi:MAG: patatin-like phospholipase family protein [Proteobacteria bacterium]|nr:patatin-like phospholipase family protein [Pseudomonadota bacterium]
MGEESVGSRRVGLALGSGSARGWAHLGVIEVLVENGIEPEVVCGTSIGALVGAFYVADQLPVLSDWASGLKTMDMVRFLDITLGGRGGFIEGGRLIDFFQDKIGDHLIEDLTKPYGAVATDLLTGQEIWFTRGSLLEAVRASISIPGIFTPVRRGDQWLVDGGLVNPVPVSLCRALGADVVLAVDLNGKLVGRHFRTPAAGSDGERPAQGRGAKSLASSLLSDWLAPSDTPGVFDVLAGSLNIMQDRISRSRMAGDPPDVLVSPRVSHLELLDFDRAEEARSEGREAARNMLPAIRDVLSM